MEEIWPSVGFSLIALLMVAGGVFLIYEGVRRYISESDQLEDSSSDQESTGELLMIGNSTTAIGIIALGTGIQSIYNYLY